MSEEIRQLGDLGRDLARTHRQTQSDARDQVDPAQDEADWAALRDDGFVVLRDVLDRATLDAVRDAVGPLLGPAGRNDFEGTSTRRVYALVAKTRATDPLVEHPRVLALLDRLLQPGYLLSQAQVIDLGPGETAQLLHPDDAFYPVPRPRPALGAATIWAIDDFTADNGATVVVPGSHRWGDDRVAEPAEAQPVVMAAGSVVVFVGTLWHGGGANNTDRSRLAVTTQFCEPWLRQQENFSLSTPPAVVAEVSDDLRRMLGYSIYGPFMGMVDGMHPNRTLPSRQ